MLTGVSPDVTSWLLQIHWTDLPKVEAIFLKKMDYNLFIKQEEIVKFSPLVTIKI